MTYNTREKVPWCMPVAQAIAKQSLPQDCPYAPEGYQSRMVEAEEAT